MEINDLQKAFTHYYKGETAEQRELIHKLVQLSEKYLGKGCGGNNGRERLCSLNDRETWHEGVSEVLVAHLLDSHGIAFECPQEGPDFLVSTSKNKIWIEVITPKSEGLPDHWVKRHRNIYVKTLQKVCDAFEFRFNIPEFTF